MNNFFPTKLTKIIGARNNIAKVRGVTECKMKYLVIKMFDIVAQSGHDILRQIIFKPTAHRRA